MKAFTIGIVGFVLGLTAHVLWGSRSAAEAAAAARPTSAQAAIDWERLHKEMRIAVREELALSARRTNDGAKPPEAPPTPEQTQAAAEHAQLLQRAIEAGVWRDADAAKLRTLLPRMAPGARFDALNAVSTAINQNRFKVEARPPF